jgi:hypothetical protein
LINSKQTAGQLSLKASFDETKYDSLEVGHALTEDVAKELAECAHNHNKIFDEDRYCVGYVLAGDPLIKNVMRRKFFAMLYLPSPRPNQAVFLYNKRSDRFEKRLWVLPNAATMAELSELPIVSTAYRTMKAWSDAFFEGKFWPFIRKQHGIDMLSEIEYLKANREKLIKSGCKEVNPLLPQPFDFSKITVNKVVNAITPIGKQEVLKRLG